MKAYSITKRKVDIDVSLQMLYNGRNDFQNGLPTTLSEQQQKLVSDGLEKFDTMIHYLECMKNLLNDNALLNQVEIIVANFATENISIFSNSFAFYVFEYTVQHRANVPPATFSFVNKHKEFPSTNPEDITLVPEKDRNHALELLIELLLDYINTDKNAIWLVAHQLLSDAVVDILSAKWHNRYPQFKQDDTPESVIKMYVDLGLSNKDYDSMFQLACWLRINHREQMGLCEWSLFVEQKIPEELKSNEYAQFKAKMLNPNKLSMPTEEAIVTIEKIDQFSGIEFEQFIGKIFTNDGYKVEYTKATNDKGIDIIARRTGVSLGIQCKCYNSPVSLSAVQEVFSGQTFYNLNKAMVITNSVFTKSAVELAKSLGVILWDRDVLKAKISLL